MKDHPFFLTDRFHAGKTRCRHMSRLFFTAGCICEKETSQKSLRPLINECSLFLTGTAFTTERQGSDIDCLWMLGEHNTTTIFSWQGPLLHTKDKGPAKYIMMPPMDALSPELLSCRKDKVQKILFCLLSPSAFTKERHKPQKNTLQLVTICQRRS